MSVLLLISASIGQVIVIVAAIAKIHARDRTALGEALRDSLVAELRLMVSQEISPIKERVSRIEGMLR